MSDQDHQYSLYLSHNATPTIASVRRQANGKVTVGIQAAAPTGDGVDFSYAAPTQQIKSTAEECSWNVYASKPYSKPKHWSNRVQLVDTSMNGRTVRIGNQIFLHDCRTDGGASKPFSPKDFSLSLAHVEQHGRYLFVTSRRKTTDVPEFNDEDGKAEDDKGGKNPFEKETSKLDNKAADGNKSANEVKDESKDVAKSSSSESDSDDEKTDATSVEDEELSAYESWSEGSTDLDDIGIQPVAELQPLAFAHKLEVMDGDSDVGAADSDSSSDEQSNCDSHSCSPACSDEESVVGKSNRYTATRMSDSEEERMLNLVYDEDPLDPRAGHSSSDGEAMPEEVWEDSAYGQWGKDEDFDGFEFQPEDSDSDCSACGDDGGATCLVPEPATEASEDEEVEDVPPGIPMAQIHVYDTSVVSEDTEGKTELKRMFRFQAPTAQVLHDSPPVVHPKKTLLVWPIGDGKLLFTDYKYNTYFIKKIRVSRLWSQQISVNIRFSDDGQFLHVAVLEKWGEPPMRVKKPKKGAQPVKNKQKTPRYDFIVSTYRLSKGKTIRAPPVLVDQTKQYLGQIEKNTQLPQIHWTSDQVSAMWTAKSDLKIMEIGLLGPHKSVVSQAIQTFPLPAKVAENLEDTEIHLLPSDGNDGKTIGILAIKLLSLKPIMKPKTNATDKPGPAIDNANDAQSHSSDEPQTQGLQQKVPGALPGILWHTLRKAD